MASTWIEVVPAYDRDYKNQTAVKKDWNADLDFRDTESGRYINKSGAKAAGLRVIIRYDRNLKVMQAPA